MDTTPRNWNFARLFEDVFVAKNIKCQTLADTVGCTTRTLTRFFNGEKLPSKRLAIALGVALGLNLDEMILFLYYAGYTLSYTLDVDRNYIQAIKKTEGMSGTKRIFDCDTILCNNNVQEKNWLLKHKKENVDS